MAGRRPGLRADDRRRLWRICRGAGGAMPAGARWRQPRRRRRPARDLLHGVDQRLRAHPSQGGRGVSAAGRVERHRHHRDPARQGVRRQGAGDRRLGREMPRLPRLRRRCRDQLPHRGFREDRQGIHQRPRGRRDLRHGRRRLHPARARSVGAGGAAVLCRADARNPGRGRFRPDPAQAPDRHRLDPALAHGRAEGGDRRRAEGKGVAVVGARANCAPAPTRPSRWPRPPKRTA